MSGQVNDTYKTIAEPNETISRERSSKFLAFAWPVEREEQIKELLDTLRKRFFDATHHCYAWRLGFEGEYTRANDDGEPSGTAGRPILGQILSARLTNVLVVVVRYFGGTKLGVPGLIKAYKEAAEEVLTDSQVIERVVEKSFELKFKFERQGDVMRLVKESGARVLQQNFDNVCTMEVSVRLSESDAFDAKYQKMMSY